MDERRRIAAILRDYLARERISRDEFAHRTRIGRSTVDKLLIGLFSDRTLAMVEGTTGLALRGPVSEPAVPDGAPGCPSLHTCPCFAEEKCSDA